MITLTTLENYLKSIYLDAITEHLNNCNPFFSKIEKTSRDVWGNEIRKPIDENNQIVSTLKNQYLKIEISDKSLRIANSNLGNFVDLLNAEIEELLTGGKTKINKSLFGDANSLSGFNEIFSKSEMIYGLKRNTCAKLQPLVKEEFGELSITKIEEVVDELGGEIDMIICSFDVKRAYIDYLIEHKQNVDIVELDNGYKAVSHLRIPMIADKFCPKGTMFLLNTNNFKLHQLCDWRWLEDENGRILKQKENEPIYTATLVKYANLICDNISKQAKITGTIGGIKK